MKPNLYEVFGCKNKEELYEKMKERVDEMSPLLEFFEYGKLNIGNKEEAITSPFELTRALDKITTPTKDGARVVFVDTKNRPIHLSKMRLSQKSDIKRTLAEGLNAGGARIFLAVHQDSTLSKIEEFEAIANNIRLKVLDRFTYDPDKKSYESSLDSSNEYYVDDKPEFIKEENLKKQPNYSNEDKFNEYAEFFAKKEIKGLNIIDNRKDVMEKMKLGYQYEKSEVLGYIGYDKNNDIKSLNTLFRGGVDSSIVDNRVIMRELLKEDLKGFILYHNHPSGTTTPSREDIGSTNVVKDMAQALDIELADHFIVGKENVYSFMENEQAKIFDESEYGKNIMMIKENKLEYRNKENSEIEASKETAKVDPRSLLNNLRQKDYRGFVKALISVEKSVTDEDILTKMYDEYMKSNSNLLNDLFDDMEFELREEKEVNKIISQDLLNEKQIEKGGDKVEKIEKKKSSLLNKLKNNDVKTNDKNSKKIRSSEKNAEI
ncbi:MAG: JAB domain-containing protein [Peptoniphilaceae bacterium]